MLSKQGEQSKNGGSNPFAVILGSSPEIVVACNLAKRAARGDSTVLIIGETGVGKSVFAKAIHQASRRRGGPFVTVNCAAIPETLIESEFFGYVDGAFTGASRKGKPGKFELANGGTVFLDEIGDMTLTLQAKVLRVLQELVVERLGDTHEIPVDVRVIAATNKDLAKLMESGKFREDLYYRLNVISINIPPLRDRREDIPEFIEWFLRSLNKVVWSWHSLEDNISSDFPKRAKVAIRLRVRSSQESGYRPGSYVFCDNAAITYMTGAKRPKETTYELAPIVVNVTSL